MYSHYNHRLKATVEILHPGEYRASNSEVILSTVLGSCVAAVLIDKTRNIGGMNHFMLPGPAKPDSIFSSAAGKYGLQAMELLINDMMKLGANRKSLRAKVFGGSYVLKANSKSSSTIPDDNVDFAFTFLKVEGIPIDSYDVGGNQPRKIFFYPQTGKVMLYRLRNFQSERIQAEEEQYRRSIEQQKDEWGKFVKF